MRWRSILLGLFLGAAPVMVLSACEDSKRSRSDRDDDEDGGSKKDDVSAEPDDIAQIVLGDPEVRSDEDSRPTRDEPEGTDVRILDEFRVNVSGTAGARILVMEIAVEGTSSALDNIEHRQHQIRDAIFLLTSDYTVMELEGLDGKLRLRDDIHRRINAVLAPHKIGRVYYTRFELVA